MRRLLIDTDPGIDDAMAIHFAFALPEVEVVGLTSVFGNVTTAIATRNALRLVEMAGADCPVAEGAARPLVQPLHPPADFVHGREGFGDVPPEAPARAADPRDAAAFIVETVNASPGEIVLCPVGPLTNIALALELDPGIAGRVAGVVIMGGAIDVPGNVTQWAEANIWNDPHAADAVFAADWPMVLVALDMTERVRLSPADLGRIATEAPEIGGFLNWAAQYYFAFHRGKSVMDGCFMHDPAAVAVAAFPELETGEMAPLCVTTEGEQIGRTVRAPDTARRPVRLWQNDDIEGVRARFMTHLVRADACRDARIRSR